MTSTRPTWPRLLALAGLALGAGQTRAGSPSGLGMPAVGGGLSGPAQDGARGLVINPAAAHPEQAEILLDAFLIRYRYGYQLAGEEPVEDASQDLMPFMAAALPLGPVGIGLTAMMPHARSGSSPADAPQRFHTVIGRVLLFEADLSLAWQVLPSLSLGAGFLAGHTSYTSVVAVDTGAMLNGMLGEELVPVGDPLFEGSRSVERATGGAYGFSLGLRWQASSGLVLAGGYRSPMRTTVRGPVELIPSNDLEMALQGELVGSFAFPPEAFLAAAVPAGPVELEAELGWIGWSSLASSQQQVNDMRIVSDDAVLAALLDAYGLSDPTLLGSVEQEGVYGMHDIWRGGGGVRLALGERWGLQAGAWYAQAAVADAYMAPGNFDYDTLDLRAVGSCRLSPSVTLALSADWIHYATRHITDSIYDWDNDPAQAPALPSAAGSYWFRMGRLGLSAEFRLP